ncbi:MAG: extracellular solute-binding protein [bacterium]
MNHNGIMKDRKDLFDRRFFVMAVLIATLFIMICCRADIGLARQVVIYTSLDQIFSEPILQEFEKDTGIKVKAVYDVEAAKTTGLVNRLIAEKHNPQADVFWNSEVSRTIILKQKGVLIPYRSPSAKDIPVQFKDEDGYWTGFAARARILIYNTDLVKPADLPKSVFELTGPGWKGRVAMAYPLFGTTATHVAAWYALLGQEKTEEFLKSLKKNAVMIVTGNSVVRDMVVEGEAAIGFTDTDDANVAIRIGKPVNIIYPDKNGMGTLLIPNTIAMIKGAPHPQEAKRLIDYILSEEVEGRLAFCESAQMPLRDGIKTPGHVPGFSSIKAMDVNFYQTTEHLERSAGFCQGLFVR